mmetsp:Transcript_12327/g.34943  ORF Transcript_12327/g.34943 Transcript_12327/m.34943 type:complete len:223 (+) Transcript_12327:817-1485(+)
MEGMAALCDSSRPRFVDVVLTECAHRRRNLTATLCGYGAAFGAQGPMDDEVWVVHGLPQSHDEVEHVSVVVQDGSLVHVCVKLRKAVHVHCLVEVVLFPAQHIVTDFDFHGREMEVVVPLLLRTPQQDPVQNLAPQALHSGSASTHKAKLLDRVGDSAGKVAAVHHLGVPTLLAERSIRVEAVVEGGTVAPTLAAKVVGVRVEAQETDYGVNLSYSVLDWSA